MSKNPPWTDERCDRLSYLWLCGMVTSKIAAELNVSKNCVLGKVNRMRLPPRQSPIGLGPPNQWTTEQLDFLKAHHRDMRPEAMGEKIGRSPSAVYKKLSQLGLRHQPEEQFQLGPARATGLGTRGGITDAQHHLRMKISVSEVRRGVTPIGGRIKRMSDGMRFATCQWIAGEISCDDECKCGEPTTGGDVYCAKHRKKAYARPRTFSPDALLKIGAANRRRNRPRGVGLA